MIKPKIYRGEDRLLTVKVTHEVSKDPFNLENWTKIQVIFKGNLNNQIMKDTVPVGAEKAQSVHSDINFSAVNVGVAGNSIILVFDGVDTIQQVLDAWNIANPENQAKAEDGTDLGQVLPAASVTFSGGDDGIQYVQVINELLGKIQVELTESDTNQLRIGPDQSIKIVIERGTDRRIALVRNQLDVEDPII